MGTAAPTTMSPRGGGVAHVAVPDEELDGLDVPVNGGAHDGSGGLEAARDQRQEQRPHRRQSHHELRSEEPTEQAGTIEAQPEGIRQGVAAQQH